MLQTHVLEIKFTHKGKTVERKIDKIIFIFEAYTYTLYRLKGKECNYDLLKCGKWWQVDVVKRLQPDLLGKIGEAIDNCELKKP